MAFFKPIPKMSSNSNSIHSLPMSKGFTLIELMIVVAIIGILAAVAVPNFIRYIKDAKTSEAKENLKAISDGALSFYSAEHPLDMTGVTISKQYPSEAVCVTHTSDGAMSCAFTSAVPTTLPVVGVKSVITDAWLNEPWKSLKFSIAKAFYYRYQYISKGSINGGETAFQVLADAKLEKNDKADSCFTINGTEKSKDNAVIGAIIDLSETGDCPSAPTVPSSSE